jgi:hypothetical protein
VFSPTNVEDQTGEMSPAMIIFRLCWCFHQQTVEDQTCEMLPPMSILVSPLTAAAQLPRGLFVIHWLFVFLGVNDCYRNFVLIQKVTKKIKTEKSFSATGQTPGPLFCQAFARFLFFFNSKNYSQKEIFFPVSR